MVFSQMQKSVSNRLPWREIAYLGLWLTQASRESMYTTDRKKAVRD